MKFKLDENLGEFGRDLLEKAGHDVMTVAQQSLCGARDETLFAVCKQEGRALVTLDHDFGQITRFAPGEIGTVILECRGRLTPDAIRARIRDLVAVLRTHALGTGLWVVEPGRVRMRQNEDL